MRAFVRPFLVAAVVVAAVLARFLRGRRETIGEVSGPAFDLPPPLTTYLDAVHSYASESEPGYMAAIAKLRAEPSASARAIMDAYKRTGDEESDVRESLLLAAAALADRAVLPLLIEVARTPVRAGDSVRELSREARISKLRLMAVDGIHAIAAAGDSGAWDALEGLVESPDRAVQAAAVVAFNEADTGGDRLQRIGRILPNDRKFLLDVRRANVRDVPQIPDPTRHLAGPPQTLDRRPDPDARQQVAVEKAEGVDRIPVVKREGS